MIILRSWLNSFSTVLILLWITTKIRFTIIYRGNSSTRADASDPPRVEIQRDSVLKTALAGGLSCSFSTLLMHPIDTVKVSPVLAYMYVYSYYYH